MSDDKIINGLYELENLTVAGKSAIRKDRPDLAEKYLEDIHDGIISLVETRNRGLEVFGGSFTTKTPYPTLHSKTYEGDRVGDDIDLNFEDGEAPDYSEFDPEWNWKPSE